jgi:hypothetical protein
MSACVLDFPGVPVLVTAPEHRFRGDDRLGFLRM